MQYTWHFQYCPKCKKMYSRHIDKLLGFIKMESGLGPQFIRCASCGNVFNSGLTEWQQMTTAQKTRYGFLSIFYSGFIGVSLLLPTMVIHSKFSQSGNPQLMSENLFLLITFIVYSLLVLALQVLRTFLSDSRMESTTPEPMDVSFWNWQTNLQFYGLAICLIGDVIFALVFTTMM